MNKDQVQGSLKDAAGKVQREAGKITGSKEQQIKGAGRQVEGKTQKAYDDVRDQAKK